MASSIANRPLADFQLTESERIYYHARTNRALDQVATEASAFKSYYNLPTQKPFWYILGMAGLIVIFSAAVGVYLFLERRSDPHLYPLMAAAATILVAAVGWCSAAWIAHRNAVRQNTTSLIFARFSQSTYTENLHNFHSAFGYADDGKVTSDLMRAKRTSGCSTDQKAAESVIYILNYLEFMAVGILAGDLDADIVRKTLRGIVVYYYDKCEPYIVQSSILYPKAFESLIKLRTHYRTA